MIIQSNQKKAIMVAIVASVFILAFANMGIAKSKLTKGTSKSVPSKTVAKATPKSIANGKKVYGKICMTCHAIDGGGTIGPNLTDKYWIHGNGDFNSIMNVILHGVPAKGMLPKGGLPLKQQDIVDLTHYVQSLQGTKPAKPKAAEGKLIK